MKLITQLMLLGVVVPVLAWGDDEGLARDRAKASLVVHAAAVQVVEETGQLSRPAAEGDALLVADLARAMLARPDKHRRADESRKQCLDTLARIQQERVQGIVSQAVAVARQQSPLPVSAEQVLAKAGASTTQLAVRAMAGWKTNGVERIFNDARRQAVDQQRRELDDRLQYPSQDKLDSLLLSLCPVSKEPAARLAQESWNQVRTRLGQADPAAKAAVLLEENEKHLQGASSRMAEAIRSQYDTQVGDLEAAAERAQLPQGAIDRATLADHLRAQVEQAAAVVQPESGSPRYAVFAVVHSNITARAAVLEIELLADYARGSNLAAVTVEQLAAMIAGRPDVYRSAEAGLAAAVREKSSGLASTLAAAYAGAAGKPATAPHLEALLVGDSVAGTVLRARVQAEIEAGWPQARKRVTAEQVARHFPGLDRDEPLTAAQAELGCDQLRPLPDSFPGLVAALRAFDTEWVVWTDQPLLQESEARVAELAQQRISLACDAIEKQQALVRDLEAVRKAGLEQDVAADRPFRTILQDWNDDLAKRWSATEGAGPAAYPDLFPRTLDLLNKTVRQLYDACRQEQDVVKQEVAARAGAETSADQAEPAPTELRKDEFQSKATEQESKDEDVADAKPEPKKPEGMGAVEYVWKTQPDAVLMVRDTRWRRAQVVLMDGEQTMLASATFRPDKTDDAAQEIYTMITPALTQALDSRKEGWKQEPAGEGEPGPQLKVFLLVQSREIRHLTSLKLRHLMQVQVDEWSAANRPEQSPVNLVWIVGL